MEAPEGVDIQEVNSTEANYYDPVRDSIVMDKRLELYPELREEILEHEIEHAWINRNSGSRTEETVRNLFLDVQTDLFRIAGWSKNNEADDTYHYEEIQRPKFYNFHYGVGNILRQIIALAMVSVIMPILKGKSAVEYFKSKLL